MNCGTQNPRVTAMRIGNRDFRPRLWPTIATVVLLPVLIALGFWQLDRAQEKQAIQERFEHRARKAPLVLGADMVLPDEVHYRRVTARGTYDGNHQLLIDNKVFEGRAGYQVLTPLRLEDSDTWVLVNRGWVAQGADRGKLPAIPVPRGPVEVHGLAGLPEGKPLFIGDHDRENKSWPAVVLWVNLARYAKATGYRLQPIEILQDPKDPGDFPRHWQIVALPPEQSVSYAVQWFALAAALAIIYLVVNTHRIESDDDSTPATREAGGTGHE